MTMRRYAIENRLAYLSKERRSSDTFHLIFSSSHTSICQTSFVELVSCFFFLQIFEQNVFHWISRSIHSFDIIRTMDIQISMYAERIR